jgi:hypothetical protein
MPNISLLLITRFHLCFGRRSSHFPLLRSLTPGPPPVLGNELDVARSSGTAAAADAFDSTTTWTDPMSAPSEEQTLERAKELCRCEGKAWNLDDFKNGVSGVTMLAVVADDNDRTKYLNRANAILKQKDPVRSL